MATLDKEFNAKKGLALNGTVIVNDTRDLQNINSATISNNSANPALKITQAGTGHALVVEDVASDTTPFIVDQNGNVGIGVASPTKKLDVAGDLKTTGQVLLGQGVAQANPSTTDIPSTSHTVLGGNGGNAIHIGQYPTWDQWIQSSFSNPTTAKYNLILQPLGGKVGVGRVPTTNLLEVEGTVSATAVSATGAVTAASFSGSGASLTSLNADNVSTGTLPLTRGGTGATSAAGALTSILPAGGTSGQVLKTAGAGSFYWANESGGGSVVGTRIDSTRTFITATNNQTVLFVPKYQIGASQARVYINGARLFNADYTESVVQPTISTVARSGTTVTIATSAAHNLLSGDLVYVSLTTNTTCNVTGVAVTVTGGTSFTYPCGTSGTITAVADTGTLEAYRVTLGVGASTNDSILVEIDGYKDYTQIAAGVTFVSGSGIGAANVQDAIIEVANERQPLDADLTAIAGLSTTGLINRTGDGVMATMTAPSSTIVGINDTQTLTNKTLTTPTITLKQSTAPTPTAEGDIQWDTDGDFLVIGNGSGQTIIPSTTSTHTFTNKTWNGSVIGVSYGGTGVATISGMVKGNGTSAFTAAVAGTDFVAPGAITSSALTISTARLAGRTTAATGAIEEISIGSGLSLSAGVLSCTVTSPVSSVFGRTGAVVLQSSDVTTALGYTPVNKAGDTVTGSLSIQGTGVIGLSNTGDITCYRAGGTTGVIFLSSAGNKYLYFNGTNYEMPNGNLIVNGSQVLTTANGSFSNYVPKDFGAGNFPVGTILVVNYLSVANPGTTFTGGGQTAQHNGAGLAGTWRNIDSLNTGNMLCQRIA